MKLVELLAKELKDWPECAKAIVQDKIMLQQIWYTKKTPAFESNDWGVVGGDRDFVPILGKGQPLSEDWKTAIVTREMWQAERERIAKPGKKANADGWIRHRGGKCPVEAGAIVVPKFRSGDIGIARPAEQLAWSHTKELNDVMRYRIHKPAESIVSKQDGTHSLGCVPSSIDIRRVEHLVDVDGSHAGMVGAVESPAKDSILALRDRIREIDRTVEALEEERVSLIQRLEGEGFKLIDQVNAKIAEAAQANEDMSDWRNWRVGDLVECVNDDGWMSFIAGKKYSLISIDGGELELVGSAGRHVDITEFPHDFKWHSRPSA